MDNARLERSSNLELLRVISMFMIVLFHCSYHGKLIGGGYNSYIINTFNMLGEFGVNLFILISGYFYDKSHFKPKKFIGMMAKVWFYVAFGILIAVLMFHEDIVGLIKVWIFPLLKGKYWFATAYLLLYLFQPYIIKFIRVLTEKELRNIIGLMLFIWCILPTITGKFDDMCFFNQFIWFVVMYVMGAFIKRQSALISLKISIVVFLLTTTVTFFYIIVATKLSMELLPGNYFWPANSVIQVLAAVSLFSVFTKIHLKNIGIINYLASCTFGIYLLHDGVLRNFIWCNIFGLYLKKTNMALILSIVSASIAVFLIGAIVESLLFVLAHLCTRSSKMS